MTAASTDPAGPAVVLCQSGYEALLVREITASGGSASESGPGWALAELPGVGQGLAFAHAFLPVAVPVEGAGVGELARGTAEWFLESVRGERIEGAWPLRFDCSPAVPGLGRRAASVEQAFREHLGRKLGRVARLASADTPRLGPSRGLFAWFADFGRIFLSREAVMSGPRRMADDRLAPSRSYLKVEEAYALVGAEPAPGETVCDLGAAPGGWSYSAAKRGARVIAVDNGPLKAGAKDNPLIEHRPADAFGFVAERPCDWLFCDMLEEPSRVVASIARPWLEAARCRRFIINLKFGRTDPLALLGELRRQDSPFSRHAHSFRITHLYHDREEFTVTGSLIP